MDDMLTAYLAGIVDGEGYIGIKKSKAYRSQERATPGYAARIQVRMVTEPAIKLLAETLGGWYYAEKASAPNRRTLYCWQLDALQAEQALVRLLPHLRVKKNSALAVLELRHLQRDSRKHRTKVIGTRPFRNQYGAVRLVDTKALSDEYVAQCESLWLRCRTLNKVGA